jgi:ketosteroid isomerase-like protein
VAGQSKYECTRCGWPAPATDARSIRSTSRKSTNAKLTVRNTSAVEKPEPVEPPHEAEPAPALDPEAAIELDETVSRMDPKDDAEQVKDAIYYYLALLNAGDVSIRANCCLSDFTSFAEDAGPLRTGRSGRRQTGPTSPFNLRCRDLRVYIYKDTAIATAYLVGTTTNGNEKPTRVSGRTSWVLLRQSDDWKIAHNHSSPLNPEI